MKAKALEDKRKYLERYHALVAKHLEANPCIDCGESDPLVLEFDHREPSEKSFTIGRSLSPRPIESVISEIEKCDVRCANCHRRRTAKQQNSWRWKLYG